MRTEYRIHPSIGVARIGNSPTEFYLAPIKTGGRPIECNQHGDEIYEKESIKFVKKYKDVKGRVKRQAAKFWIYRHDTKNPEGVLVNPLEEFDKIEWRVHLANKKAAWYEFIEYQGDLLFGENNSYESCNTPLRNPDVKDRQKLIIDPGPRTLTRPQARSEFTKNEVPKNYAHASFPKKPLKGTRIKSLGEIRTDSKNNLLVLGGFGFSGGDQDIANSSFGGQDTWHDDISDGPITCTIYPKRGQPFTLDAWVIVGSPNFVPEIPNITTLDDIMFDVAVRKMGKFPRIFDKRKEKRYRQIYNSIHEKKFQEIYKNTKKKYKNEEKAREIAERKAREIAHKKTLKVIPWKWGWNPNYKANYKRDIEPIMKRPAEYRWLANVPSMVDFAMPPFDVKNTKKYKKEREQYFRYWRRPGYVAPGFRTATYNKRHDYGDRNKAFSEDIEGMGIPLMPVNSGSNVITNEFVDKFTALSSMQYFMLKQWVNGKLSLSEEDDTGIHPLDRVGVGNCVGLPMCPGIEVTWTVRNQAIYSVPYGFKHRKKNYNQEGLEPLYDETRIISKDMKGDGCEPGDLTKRMANPWQSDLFNCNLDYVTFREKHEFITKVKNDIPPPPTFAAYWWPPSAPWDVMAGIETEEEQQDSGFISAGRQVKYRRGIHSIEEMIRAWSYLGFIVNQNDGEDRKDYPYFVEKERNHKEFEIVKQPRITPDWPNHLDSTYEPEFYLKDLLK